MRQAPLDIVIVNWNSGSQLRECVASIADTRGAEIGKVVVVDNASSDDSLAGIDAFDLPLVLIRNSCNRGFAAACNQGAREGEGKYLLFLNPDTVLLRDSLAVPVKFMEGQEHGDAGIAGIQLVDEEGQVWRSCARFPGVRSFFAKIFGLDRIVPSLFPGHFMTEWDHRHTREVDQVIGAFFLVRRSLFQELGCFDERFFVYFEEVDFACRAKQAGWRSFYVAGARAFHRGGGTSDRIKGTRLYYYLRSWIHYCFKHYPIGPAAVISAASLCVEPFTRLILSLARRSGDESAAILSGYGKLWRNMGMILGECLRDGRKA